MPGYRGKEYEQKRRIEGRIKNYPGWERFPKKEHIPWEFIGVDGEGIGGGSEQKYVLLASSQGQAITRKEGLTTEECLDFLLSLKKPGERKQVVGFRFGYDINWIIKDLPLPCLEAFRDEEQCYWCSGSHKYSMKWAVNKSFTIERGPLSYKKSWIPDVAVTIWDVFGFYQSSFLSALEEWNIGTPEELKIISAGKEERGSFRWENLEEIIRYNSLECSLLVKLISQLQEMMLGLDLKLSRWDGAGAIASTLMKKHGIKRYIDTAEQTKTLTPWIMRAYFGGRTQVLKVGIIDGPIYHYDINSAYPAVIKDLPSLKGRWEFTREYRPDHPWALWRCDWSIGGKTIGKLQKHKLFPIFPFPFRMKDGSIMYPPQGRGIYHAPLVKVAVDHWKKEVQVLDGWCFYPDKDVKPFEWVEELYQARRELKKAGDRRHIPLKLGLNSLYGKMAQGVSYGVGEEKRRPPYQSYFWAGLVTAKTQAILLQASLQCPSDICFMATDGIFSCKPLAVPTGWELGTWEHDPTPISKLSVFQPGLYAVYESEGEPYIERTRGFHPDDVSFDLFEEAWKKDGPWAQVLVPTERFIELRLALHLNKMERWRNWHKEERKIRLHPYGLYLPGWGLPDIWPKGKPFCEVTDKLHLIPPYVQCVTGISHKFSPKDKYTPIDDFLHAYLLDYLCDTVD